MAKHFRTNGGFASQQKDLMNVESWHHEVAKIGRFTGDCQNIASQSDRPHPFICMATYAPCLGHLSGKCRQYTRVLLRLQLQCYPHL